MQAAADKIGWQPHTTANGTGRGMGIAYARYENTEAYVATAADVIVAHPTTITGGIGVILNLYNLEDAMGYFNVREQSIKSGVNIDIGTSRTRTTSIAPTSPCTFWSAAASCEHVGTPRCCSDEPAQPISSDVSAVE